MKRAVCRSSDSRTPAVRTPCSSSQCRYSSKSAPTAPTSSGRRPSTPRPKAMLAATPPRRMARSSTRNESETLSSLSAMSWSVNLPGNVIRWSVAIDPVTAMRTAANPAASVEGVAAGARTRGVRVVDGETLLLDRVDEVDRRAHQVRGAHLVRHDLHAAEVGDDVAVDLAFVEVELVAKPRAAARLDRDAQPQVVPALLREQATHLGGRALGQDDALCGLLLNSHLSSRLVRVPHGCGVGDPTCSPNDKRCGCIPATRTVFISGGTPSPRPPSAFYSPGAPQTGNQRARSGSHFRSSPTTPLTWSSSALSRRSPFSGAKG